MLYLLPALLLSTSWAPREAPIPAPREKEVFRFSVLLNTREGFQDAAQLTLEKNGGLYTTNGRRVKDDDIGFHCVSEPGKKEQKLVLVVFAPTDISAGKLVETLEKIETAARERKIHLTVTVLTRSP